MVLIAEHGIDIETLYLSFSEFLLAEVLLFFKGVLLSSKLCLLLRLALSSFFSSTALLFLSSDFVKVS